MITANTVLGKAAALAMLPSLTLGVFAMPALASAVMPVGNEGVTTVVSTTNMNNASVVNAIAVKADTGDNTANGGDGAKGGNSGTSGSGAGVGGAAGDGGNGGSADVDSAGYAEGGWAGEGGNGGNGGSTGDTGAAGNGAAGGAGGHIDTGNASAAMALYNAVNVNTTEIALPDCNDCAKYNEFYAAADAYYEKTHEESSESSHCGRHCSGSESDWSAGSEVKDSHWETYYKEFVPVTTMVMTSNFNVGKVMNMGMVEATTGDNTANGGEGGKGGTSGNSGSGAGVGGEAGDGGNGGSADVDAGKLVRTERCDRDHHCDDNSGDGTAVAGDGADGGNGGTGGSTGDTGAAGDGAVGGVGGVIVTGHASSIAGAENYVNVNDLRVTRIVR